MNAKIRNAQNQKIPFMLILGEKEQTGKAVSLRTRARRAEEPDSPGGLSDPDRRRGEAEDPGLEDMIDMIIKRDGRAVPFDREKITSAVYRAAVACGGQGHGGGGAGDGRRPRHACRAARTAARCPTVEEVQDLVEKALIERGHARTAKAYIVYRYEHALKRAGRESLTYSSENIPYRKLWEALSWAIDHGCVTLDELSGTSSRRAGTRDLVEASDDVLRERA